MKTTVLNRIKRYRLILSIIGAYALLLFILGTNGILSVSDFVGNITIFIGWIVALLIAGIHLSKTRKDNKELKREEIRRSLEIDAFREINKAVTNFGSALVEVSNKYLWWPYELKMYREDPRYHKFNKAQIELKTDQQRVHLMGGLTDFVLAIEANEIAVIQYDHLRKYIQFKVDDVNELIMKFSRYLMVTKREVLLTEPGYLDFKKRCKKIGEELHEIGSYLFDYRIELMNSMLGETFDSQVPIRKPKDPKYKTLTQVAIKEEVEKEAEEREKKFLKQSQKEHYEP